MSKAKKASKSKVATWEDYARVEFEAVDFEGGTPEQIREVYMERFSMFAMCNALLQKDHLGCKEFVRSLDQIGSETLRRFLADLKADQEYFESVLKGLRDAEMRLLAGAARYFNEQEAGDAAP